MRSNQRRPQTQITLSLSLDMAPSRAQSDRRVCPDAQVVLQEEQLGTGHAVAQAKAVLGDYDGDILVLYGDTPFISDQTIADIATARANADLVVLGFHAADPGRYGRLVTDGDALEKIVEYKDASAEERAITLCNSGVMAARAADMFDWIDATGNENASGNTT